jgi:SAM-dependent methyltransferase
VAELAYLSTTRAAYDSVAAAYAERFSGGLAAKPLDRAVLAAFGEYVQAAGAGPVADLGCGPGHVTAHLHALGLSAFGVDLSPAMIALARQAHPDLRFVEGSMTGLDLADGALGGIVAWYSVIHIPPERLPATFAEFYRVLAPGGHLLLAFQAVEASSTGAQAFDHKVSLAYRWPPGRVAELLREVGFTEIAQLLREPTETERFQQASALVRKPG